MATNNSINSSTVGLEVFSAGTFTGRTLTGTANQVSISNGDGTAGNPTIALTSTIYVSGISFDSGSNTLSSYSTGTFTPTLTAVTTDPTVSYTVQVGRYTRIGNRVVLSFHITLSAYSGGSGNIQISTLPFTSEATSSNNVPGWMYFAQVTDIATAKWNSTRINSNNTVILFSFSRTAGGAGSLDVAAPSATSDVVGSIIYEV